MAIQFSEDVLDARNDATRDAIGSAPTLKIFALGGSPAPASPAAADVGTVLATLTLPTSWLDDSSGGLATILGSWSATGSATGEADFFRIYQGSSCKMQGTITATGGGGDIEFDDQTVGTDRTVSITGFTLTG